MTTQIVLDSPPKRYDIEAGYDAEGRFVYDQLALDPVGDPLTSTDDEIRHVRVRNGAFELLDAQGQPVAGGIEPPTLTTVFETTSSDPLVILDGIVLTSFPSVGMARTRGGSTATVTDVTQSGSTVTVSSMVESTDPEVPDLPQRRVYVQSGSEYVLSEVQTTVNTATPDVQVTGQATFRLANVTWSRNVPKDDARQSVTGPDPWATSGGFGAGTQGLPPPGCDRYPDGSGEPFMNDPPKEDPSCFDPYYDPGPGANTSCQLTPGGANITYVHGILATGAAWGNATAGTAPQGGVSGPVRCALQIGNESAPTLTTNGTGSHAQQASELLSHVQGLSRSRTIFVAHSQGGLISRRVAQTPWGTDPNHVRAIVTTGTPHRGAPIANTLSPSPLLQGAVRAFTAGATGRFSVCKFGDCVLVRSGLEALQNGLLSVGVGTPAMRDLRPGSSAIAEVNNGEEGNLPRFGIQHTIRTRWAVAQVAGDFLASNSGERARAVVRDVHAIAVATAFIGGVASIFVPWVAPIAAAAAYVAVTLNVADLLWTRITVGNDQGDGVVQYQSQLYPDATFNYRALNPVSHTGEIDTKTSSLSISRVLEQNAGVARK